MKHVLKYLFLFAIAAALHAQVSPTVTIQTPTACLISQGVPMANGTLTVAAVEAGGGNIPFSANGKLYTRGALSQPIVAGQLTSPIVLPNPAVTSPASIGYTFTIQDAATFSTTTFKAVAVAPDGSGNWNLCALPAGTYISAQPVIYATGPAGPAGPQGPAGLGSATVSIGTVTTVAYGTPAAVTNTGTPTAGVLNFTLPAGPTGLTGPTGATGAQGPAGPTGPQGATGAAGSNGAAGTNGTTPTFTMGTVTGLSYGATPTASFSGTAPNYVLNLGIPAGAPGSGGSGGTPTFSMGTVTGLSAGATPTASFSGTAPNYVLNLGIPAGAVGAAGSTGATGATGAAGTNGTNGTNGTTPTFAMGTVTGLSAGATPTASFSGTAPNYTLNLGIPAGATGATGATGPTGPTGSTGATGIEGNPVAVKSANYTATTTDFSTCNDLVFTATATLTLPATPPTPNGECIMLTVLNSSTITVSPNGATLDGSTSNWVITNTSGASQGFKIVSAADGTNYYTARGQASSGGTSNGTIISFAFNTGTGASTNTLSTPFAYGTQTITNENRAWWSVPYAATAKNMYLWASQIANSQPSTGSLVCTLRKNGANTALAITIAASATLSTYASDTTDTVSFAAGDRMTLACVNSATTTSLTITNITIQYQ